MKRLIASLILFLALISSASAGGLGIRLGYVVASTNPNRVGRVYIGPRYVFRPIFRPVPVIRIR